MAAEMGGQTQRAFWEMHYLISGTVLKCARWVVQVTAAFLVPWFVPKSQTQIMGGLMYCPIIPKPIWALEHGSTVWPKALNFARPKIQVQTYKSYEPILKSYSRSPRNGQPTLAHIWPFCVVLVRQVVTEQNCSHLVSPSLVCPAMPWGISLLSISVEVGIISKATLT